MTNGLPKISNYNVIYLDLNLLGGKKKDFESISHLNEATLPTNIPNLIGYQDKSLDSELPSQEKLVVKISNETIGELNKNLNDIYYEIEKSKNVLNLEESWDEAGAKKIPESVLKNAVEFLIRYSNFLYKNFQLVISTPEINPCVDGSIDLSFRNENARLLVNIQNDNNPVAVYYGDLYNNKVPIKGTVPIDDTYEHLAIWMKKLGV